MGGGVMRVLLSNKLYRRLGTAATYGRHAEETTWFQIRASDEAAEHLSLGSFSFLPEKRVVGGTWAFEVDL